MKTVQLIALCLIMGVFAETAAYWQSKDSLHHIDIKPYIITDAKFDSIRIISSSTGIYKNKAVTKDYSFSAS